MLLRKSGKHTVSYYQCQHKILNLNNDIHSFGSELDLELYECNCPECAKNGQCPHIEVYKTHYFDPWYITIPENSYFYLKYRNMWPEDTSFNEFITQYPRWLIDYIIHYWLEYYTRQGLAMDNLHIPYPKFEKLLTILKKYRRKKIESSEYGANDGLDTYFT